MSPIGPYADFKECVAKNGDKASPEGFCAWLEHKITGKWPTEMTAGMFPDPWLTAYDAALVAKKPEKEAFDLANKATTDAGFEMSRFGWVKQFASPAVKSITGVKVFAEGTWMDSAGVERTWTGKDLDNMAEAFSAGVPKVVPLKCGHTSDAFNRKIAKALDVPVELITGDQGHGQIKLGSMTSLEHKGSLLIAAFDKIPEAIANLIEGGQFATVSVEIEDAVGDFGPVITGVALLGAEEPAVDKATLERALVFAKRPGARVLSFAVGDDIPTLKGKIKAAFAVFGELFNALVGKTGESAPAASQSKPGGDTPADNVLADYPWDACIADQMERYGDKAIAERVCGAIKARHSGESKAKLAEILSAVEAEEKIKEGGIEMDMKKIAAALGLGEAATEADILAAIANLVKGAAPGGAMAKELQAATAKIAELEKTLKGQTSLAAWKEKTATFTAIPGTALENATKLADIEAKAGIEAANTQFAALEAANKLAAEAQKVVGTTRSAGPTDFDNEVAKYQKANPSASKAEAIKAVSKANPNLYFARPERQ